MTATPAAPPTGNICQTAARAKIALPCLAGATLQLKDGGGLLAVRQPPLRATKGLPSSTQLNEGFARRRANERKSASKANTNAGRGGPMEEGGPKAAELGVTAREEFVVKISRRDDILQVGDIYILLIASSVVVLMFTPLSYISPVGSSPTCVPAGDNCGFAKCCADKHLQR